MGGWSPSTVRAIIGREIYHGVAVWNLSRKRNDWGKVAQRARPREERIAAPREDLRIVPEPLWLQVAARRADVEGRAARFEDGRLLGRPPKHETRNLLAGLATCGLCGGGMIVETSDGKYARYACSRRRQNGSCSNKLRVPVDVMNEAVLSAVETHVFAPEAIEKIVQLAETEDARHQQERLRKSAPEIERRVARVLRAIEEGGDAAPLVARVRELEEQRRSILAEAAALTPVPRLAPAAVESRLDEWRRLLRQSMTQGRAVLQRVIKGRITFTPDGDSYSFRADTRFDRLFEGDTFRPSWGRPGEPTGLEGMADDTLDGDYGRMLDRLADAVKSPSRHPFKVRTTGATH
jgi:hypothetical protein